jgi:hypothetical protein
MEKPDLTLQWSKLILLKENEIKKHPIDKVEGVYRISKKEDDDKFYVIFIGSTLDLGGALSKLLSDANDNFLNQGGEFAFRYAPVKGEEERKSIEKQMYKKYVPQYNQSEPQSNLDIKVNLN